MYIIHRHRNNKKSNHRTDTSSNGTIRQKSRPHRKHMAGAHTSITINGSYPTVNVHQTIHHHPIRINNNRRRTIRAQPLQLAVYHCQPEYTYKTYVVVYDANQGDGQPSYASSRNNNIDNTNIKKNQEPHRKARRRIPRLPHPMKTIKNNLHHRT